MAEGQLSLRAASLRLSLTPDPYSLVSSPYPHPSFAVPSTNGTNRTSARLSRRKLPSSCPT